VLASSALLGYCYSGAERGERCWRSVRRKGEAAIKRKTELVLGVIAALMAQSATEQDVLQRPEQPFRKL
jgi:hypothetical protein